MDISRTIYLYKKRQFLHHYLFLQCPERVLFVWEILFNFVVFGGVCTLGGHIESVFADLLRKCGSFQCKRINEQHSFLVYV